VRRRKGVRTPSKKSNRAAEKNERRLRKNTSRLSNCKAVAQVLKNNPEFEGAMKISKMEDITERAQQGQKESGSDEPARNTSQA
jgi:hypothetical protein